MKEKEKEKTTQAVKTTPHMILLKRVELTMHLSQECTFLTA
jgi:hypothetical protein